MSEFTSVRFHSRVVRDDEEIAEAWLCDVCMGEDMRVTLIPSAGMTIAGLLGNPLQVPYAICPRCLAVHGIVAEQSQISRPS